MKPTIFTTLLGLALMALPAATASAQLGVPGNGGSTEAVTSPNNPMMLSQPSYHNSIPTSAAQTARHMYRPIQGSEIRTDSTGRRFIQGRYIGTYANASSTIPVNNGVVSSREKYDPSQMYQDQSKIGSVRWIPHQLQSEHSGTLQDGISNPSAGEVLVHHGTNGMNQSGYSQAYQNPQQSFSGPRHMYRPIQGSEIRTDSSGARLIQGRYIGTYANASSTIPVNNGVVSSREKYDPSQMYQDQSKIGSVRWIPHQLQSEHSGTLQDGISNPSAGEVLVHHGTNGMNQSGYSQAYQNPQQSFSGPRHMYRPIQGSEIRTDSSGARLIQGRYIGTYANASSTIPVNNGVVSSREKYDPSQMYQDQSKIGSVRWIPLQLQSEHSGTLQDGISNPSAGEVLVHHGTNGMN